MDAQPAYKLLAVPSQRTLSFVMALNLDEVRTKPLLCLLSSNTTSSYSTRQGVVYVVLRCWEFLGIVCQAYQEHSRGSVLIAASDCLLESHPHNESHALASCNRRAHSHRSSLCRCVLVESLHLQARVCVWAHGS